MDLARNSDFMSDYHNCLWDSGLQRQLLSRPVPGFARKVLEVLMFRDTDIASTDCCMFRSGVILRIIIKFINISNLKTHMP